MLKNILNLNGAQQLSKNEQQSIHGGGLRVCPSGTTQYIFDITQVQCDLANLIWTNNKCYYCA